MFFNNLTPKRRKMRLRKLSLLVLIGIFVLTGCSLICINSSLEKPEIISIDLPDEFPIYKKLIWSIEVNQAVDSLEVELYVAYQEQDWFKIWATGPEAPGYFDVDSSQHWGLQGVGGGNYPSRYEFRVRAWNQSDSVLVVKSFKLVDD